MKQSPKAFPIKRTFENMREIQVHGDSMDDFTIELLIFDEPTSGLDPVAREDLLVKALIYPVVKSE